MKSLESQIKNIFKDSNRSEWELVKFGDVVDEVKETCTDPVSQGLKHIVGLEHLSSFDIHIRSWGDIEDESTFIRKFEAGHVLFGRRRAYQRKAALAEFDGLCSGDIIVMKAKEEKMISGLLPFLVQSDGFYNWSVSTSAGSLSPRTKFKDLAKFQFRLPPRPIQEKLAELLWKIDELQEQTRTTIDNTQILFESLLKVLTEGNKKWQKEPLGNIVSLHYGKGLKESLRNGGQYDVVSSAGICGKHDEYIVEGPGIVLGRKGAVGEVTWIENNFWPIDTAYWVSLKNKNYDLRFVYYLLRSAKLSKLSISTAIPGINRDDIYAVEVCTPEYEEQVELRETLENLNNLTQQYTENLNSLNGLKTSILTSIL